MIRQYILPSLALAAPAAAEAATNGAALPADLSVWGMFAQADWVVKLVMLGLVVASILTWTGRCKNWTTTRYGHVVSI